MPSAWPAAGVGTARLADGGLSGDGLISGGSIGCGAETGATAGRAQPAAPAVPGSEICEALNSGPGCVELTVSGKNPATSTTRSTSATTAA